MEKIFKDLLVVELASVLAGPAVGMFFAELGAKVVKFENIKTKGDITRHWKLKSEDESLPYSAYYCSINYGKEVVMSDLALDEDREHLLSWIVKADIVIANFKESSAKKLGLDYASLKQINSNIIYAQLNGFPGASKKVAFDVVLQAETGYLSMCGLPTGEVAKMPVALIDVMAAHQLKEGILIAFLKKYKTGQGSYVVSSLFESAIASLANQATNWLMNRSIPQRMGTIHPNIAPYGEVFCTADAKDIVLAIGTDKQFENLCKVVGLSNVAEDPMFKSNTQRVENRAALAEILGPALLQLRADEFMKNCESYNIPVGKIKNLEEVFQDEQAQRMILSDEDEQGNTRKRVSTIAFSIT